MEDRDRKSIGVHAVKDETTGGKVYMCDKHYNEWKELQQIIDTYGDTNSED
jgi:uncharacterized protein (DUF779 family)